MPFIALLSRVLPRCGFLLFAISLSLPLFVDHAHSYRLFAYVDDTGQVHRHFRAKHSDYYLVYQGLEKPMLSDAQIREVYAVLRKEEEKKRAAAMKVKAGKRYDLSTLRDVNLMRYRKLELQTPAKELHAAIEDACKRYNVDANLVYYIIKMESNFNNRAVSPKGARGLMQLMPETQQHYGLDDVFNPSSNIEVGVRYFSHLFNKFSSVSLALAAYNAGPKAVEKYGTVPPYIETNNYVYAILTRYNKFLGN